VQPDTEELIIFGPAQAKFGLQKEIEHIKHYKPVLLRTLLSEYLMQNEMVVLMRTFSTIRVPTSVIKNHPIPSDGENSHGFCESAQQKVLAREAQQNTEDSRFFRTAQH
jgi:hypothetical protein